MFSFYKYATLAALIIVSASACSCAADSNDIRQGTGQVCSNKMSEALLSLGIESSSATKISDIENALKKKGLQYENLSMLPYSDCLKDYPPQSLSGIMVFLSKGPRPGESVEVLIAADKTGNVIHMERRPSYPDPLLSPSAPTSKM